MLTNLVVNGCSYTDDNYNPTWATTVKNQLSIKNYYNLASGGAGNFYICNSTINFLENTDLDPSKTVVLIMWSGTGRKDISISGEWWFYLNKTYNWGAKTLNDEYYLFSGGLSNSWQQNKETKKIFQPLYAASDPLSLTLDSLMHFKHLENYLKVRGFKYKFTCFHNYWSEAQESSHVGDYTIGFFCRNQAIYKNFDFSNWWFINDNKDTLGEYALRSNQMDETFHPTKLAHENFALEYAIPLVKQIHM